jgi:hypothetical protein
LIVDAAGDISFGITETGNTAAFGGTNAVGTLAAAAGGAFGFLNGPGLTVGTVPSIIDVASEAGVFASATPAGDVLVQTNNPGQQLTLAGNLMAGGRAILSSAGGFSQIGTVAVTAPVLAIDTTASGVGSLLSFITSTNINASLIARLPPGARTRNPMQFADLLATNSVVLLFADEGAVTGIVGVAQFGLSGTGGNADLQGSIDGLSGPTAALIGLRNPGPDPAYLFNGCIIASVTCSAVPTGFVLVQQQSVSGVTTLGLLPNLAAAADFITPEAVRVLRQSQDPDAPVINIFDEEHLCEETAEGSQPGRERCQEAR